ncbi:ammonia channel protein AmtB [Catalinimonas alkaloidigena]|uniref:hypothetical protein n=1 Tax=Catalinimonas alkaloidigena TaxID=1075417 RepID=UPI002406461F|nr:hypothetical protein [Catalinimonas alkaloidigena]MDF9795134.1 ammonia channel protein AmtB [Catalinimonas alkaloidigena]
MSRKRHFLSNAYEYFNTLTLVFYLMVGIPLVFFVLVYLSYEEQGGLRATENLQILTHIIIPLATVASIYFAYSVYKLKLRQHQAVRFQEKLKAFHEVSLYKYGLLSLANFLPVISMYYTGEQVFAGLYAIALVVFSLNRPTHQRISKDMKLSEEENQWLRSDKNFDEL